MLHTYQQNSYRTKQWLLNHWFISIQNLDDTILLQMTTYDKQNDNLNCKLN